MFDSKLFASAISDVYSSQDDENMYVYIIVTHSTESVCFRDTTSMNKIKSNDSVSGRNHKYLSFIHSNPFI